MNQTVYLCSCVPDGGLYHCLLYPDGRLEIKDKTTLSQPTYAIQSADTLYTLLRSPFPDSRQSGAMALTADHDGKLTPKGRIRPVDGETACHLALSPSGRYLYTANYVSGSVTELPVAPDGALEPLSRVIAHSGSSVHESRQTGPHAHCTVFTPDGRYLCVVDLGLDRILVYAVDDEKGIVPEPYSSCAIAPGMGPRHLAFSRGGQRAYCVNELISSITVLDYRQGHLKPLSTYSTLPDGFTGESYCAAVRLSACGRYVYASNRGHDSIACFAVEGQALRLFDIVPCGGRYPRDFDLTPDGTLMVCANEHSGNVTTFTVDSLSGRITPTGFSLDIPAALGVTYLTAK